MVLEARTTECIVTACTVGLVFVRLRELVESPVGRQALWWLVLAVATLGVAPRLSPAECINALLFLLFEGYGVASGP